MKKYNIIILSQKEIVEKYGKECKFRNGFLVYDPEWDLLNKLEKDLNQPVVSVRPSGRESWREVLVITANGYIREDGIHVLDYQTKEEIITILMDIFCEGETDEYTVFEWYAGTCPDEVWEEVRKWVYETY